MTMRAFIITLLLPLAFVATGAVEVAHAAPVTDCSYQGVGVSCVTSSGAGGTCQPSYDILGNMSMTCQVTSASSQATNPSPITNQNPSPIYNPGGSNTYTPSQSVSLINPLQGVDCSKGNGNCLSAFLLDILQFVIYIGSIVVILMLVYVGYKFVVAQGAPEKIEEARKALLWTIIGALVLLGAQAIAMGIQATVTALTGG